MARKRSSSSYRLSLPSSARTKIRSRSGSCCLFAISSPSRGLSTGLVDDDVAEEFLPFITLVQQLYRIDNRERNAFGQRFDFGVGRDEIALGENRLPVREQEIAEEDGGIRMG